ncbi:MAG: flagellar hook capping FlgD N-terminal domain-containing protein, partial [Trichlorobacter sp.]|nr:flagellar hook capping FlgD N-terminal domain-containing protein [Trichlorobacter sp.]
MSTQIGDVTTTSATYSAADDMKQKLGMNKDDFLKLFIAQLQHQDPLAPQDP